MFDLTFYENLRFKYKAKDHLINLYDKVVDKKLIEGYNWISQGFKNWFRYVLSKLLM